MAIQRVTTYIDGFNLYYALKTKGWQRYYWLDLHRLSENLLRPWQRLVAVHYFTARVLGNPNKSKRQNTYLEALATLANIQIHYGYFLLKDRTCDQCGATWQTYEEKMTDVNIAVRLLDDAQDNVFDTAIIISADGDLAGPLRAVRGRYPRKRVIVAFPPGRYSDNLQGVATTSFHIGRRKLHGSLLPNRVAKSDGYILTRPSKWK
ncbi:MAG: NYN domain-containing protein [Truepera sp.]|nr:NYN domain-containing protein [Truepera sp.]